MIKFAVIETKQIESPYKLLIVVYYIVFHVINQAKMKYCFWLPVQTIKIVNVYIYGSDANLLLKLKVLNQFISKKFRPYLKLLYLKRVNVLVLNTNNSTHIANIVNALTMVLDLADNFQTEELLRKSTTWKKKHKTYYPCNNENSTRPLHICNFSLFPVAKICCLLTS